MLNSGAVAPAFDLDRTRLASVLESGPVLLVFFKVSCPVCQLTLPFLQRMAGNQAVQFVGMSQDDARTTDNFSKRFGVSFPILIDPHPYPVSSAYGIETVPSHFLIETDGIISTSWAGFSKAGMEELGNRVQVKPFRPDENVPAWKAG